MRRLLLLIVGGLLVAGVFAFAHAAALAPTLPAPPPVASADQQSAVLMFLITFLTGLVIRPATALLRSWGVTAELDPRTVAAFISVVVATGLALKTGVYGTGTQGIMNAVAAAAYFWLFSYGSNRAQSLAAEGGTIRALNDVAAGTPTVATFAALPALPGFTADDFTSLVKLAFGSNTTALVAALPDVFSVYTRLFAKGGNPTDAEVAQAQAALDRLARGGK